MLSVLYVYAASAFSRVVLAATGILLVRLMAVDQMALLTLGLATAGFAVQPVTEISNRLYLLYPELGGAGERVMLIGALQLLVVGALYVTCMEVTSISPTFVLSLCIAAIGVICIEFAKTIYQSAENFRGYRRTDYLRALGVFSGIGALVALRPAVRASEVLLLQGAISLAVGIPSILANVRHTKARLVYGDFAKACIDLVSKRYALVLFTLLQGFISQADIFAIKAASTSDQLAIYGAALRYYGFIMLALTSVQAVILPKARDAIAMGQLRLILKQYSGLLLFFVIGVLVCAVAGIWVIPLIDHGRYPQSVPTFEILCLSSVISFAFGIFPIFAVSLRLFDLLFHVSIIAAALCIALNWSLASAWGAMGAATATLLTHATFNCSIFFALWRRGVLALPPRQVG
jgi:O-antigen/teichoic acid export membrane protein